MVSSILPKNERKKFDMRYQIAFEIYWPLDFFFQKQIWNIHR